VLLCGSYIPCHVAPECLCSLKTYPYVYILCCSGNLRGGSWGKVGRVLEMTIMHGLFTKIKGGVDGNKICCCYVQ
jgi:hypothetical protein